VCIIICVHAVQSPILYVASSEALVESDELPQDARNLAALVASKVYYYLAEYDEALSFALVAGPAFEAERKATGAEEYIETVICWSNSDCCTRLRTDNSRQPRPLTGTSSSERMKKQGAQKQPLSPVFRLLWRASSSAVWTMASISKHLG
jgi:hypothetical protein